LRNIAQAFRFAEVSVKTAQLILQAFLALSKSIQFLQFCFILPVYPYLHNPHESVEKEGHFHRSLSFPASRELKNPH
jgi:hypothetical protein